MKVTFGAFRGHFEVTLSISTSNFMCDACVMHTCTGLVGPKTGKVKKLLVFNAFLKRQSGHEYARESLRTSEPDRPGGGWGHFGGTLGSLWGHFGVTLGIFERLCVTLRSLWNHCGITLGV